MFHRPVFRRSAARPAAHSAAKPATRSFLPLITALSALPLLLSLGGCNRAQAPDDLMADARRYRDQGDAKAAIIQLKNAVQQQPDNAAARLMLGQMYVESGDMLSAEKELRRARELGALPQAVLPPLGKALLLQGQYQRLLDDIPDDPANALALALRGHALLGLDRTEEARAQFRRALQRQPGLSEATVGLAKVALIGNQPAQATQLVDQAITQDPASVDTLRLKGDLQRAGNDSGAARETYEKILELKPNNVQARVDIANLDIEQGHFKEAREQIKLARKAQPNSLLIFYSQALLEFREGHYQAALDQLQQVLRAVPDHMPSVLLAGAVELALGSNTQAEQYLNRYLSANPGNAYATKLLATIALRNNQADEALAMIRPLLKGKPDDVELLALAGEAEMRGRHFDQAAEYFQKASELKPDAAELRLAHGVSRLGLGENPRAIAELEQASNGGATPGRAGVLLVLTHLRGKQFDKALEAVDAMIRNGDNPMLQNLRGGVLLARSDVDGARAGFMKALALDPMYVPALDNLGQLDVMENKPQEARKRYEAALAKDRKNVGLMTSLAKLATRQGDTAEAIRWLELATRENPNAAAPAQMLATYYVRAGEKQKALNLAQKLQATDPSNAEVLALLAEAQSLSGQDEAAIESFERLASLQPKSAGVQLRIANLYLQRSRIDDALLAARKAVKAEPDNVDALMLLNSLLIEKNAYAEAATLAGSYQARHADSPVGYKLEGDLLMAQQKPKDALQRYERGLELAPSGALQVSVHRALVANGRGQDAVARMTAWLEKHPADQPARIYFASAQMAAGDYQLASRHLDYIVQKSPDNVVALNDLAWSLLQLKDPRALGYAEKAYQLAPKNAAVADTLAAVLLDKGDAARALPLLKKAVDQAPKAPDIRLHLAQALLRTGDKKAARAQCEQLLALPAFKRQAEVRALLAQM